MSFNLIIEQIAVDANSNNITRMETEYNLFELRMPEEMFKRFPGFRGKTLRNILDQSSRAAEVRPRNNRRYPQRGQNYTIAPV